MRFEDSKFFNAFPSKKIVFPFGDVYFTDFFILTEVKEGIHFDSNMQHLILNAIIEHYGESKKLAYISNRVNSYSVDAQNIWTSQSGDFLVASAIVYYNNFAFITASLEKRFSKSSLKRCESLEEAINWIQSLKEFN